jgi:hypothetical protein
MTQRFAPRLSVCMRRGDLRTADLSRWFDRPYATVRQWIVEEREPSGSPGQIKELYDALSLLEQAISNKKFPMATVLKPMARIAYVRAVRGAKRDRPSELLASRTA